MSYCLNPRCSQPLNTNDGKFCLTCGSKLLLKERYRAVKPIGQGGFGRTFLALDEDKPSKPRCVIKQFYPQAQGTNTLHKAVELFNQEAMRLDELGEHPQIPDLLAYFTQDDRQYLVQEFIDGQNLAQELADKGACDETDIRQLLNDLLPVLQFCHERQVIHRDIKPENIIRRRSDRKPVLVDFGASKSATFTSLNQTGTSIGSPEYVAPEQMKGWAVFASDIYSLAVTCINLLTARSPFDLYDVHNDAWLWQKYVKSPVSGDLSSILNKMLESAPSRRYKTASEVMRDLNSQVWPTPKLIAVAKPVNQPAPKSTPNAVTKPTTQIDNELEEMKTLFLHGGKSQKPQPAQQPQQSQKPQQSQQPQAKPQQSQQPQQPQAKPQQSQQPQAKPQQPQQPQAKPQQPQQPQTQPQSAQSKSQIEKELEEMRAKYMGNNNP